MKFPLRLCVLSIVFFSSLPYSSSAQRHGLGDLTTAAEYSKIPRVAERANRDLTDLPSSYSIKQFAPPVKDQHTLSTCVGWSGAYAARTISYAILRNFTNLDSIIKYSFSPGYLYNRIKRKDDYNCTGGSSVRNAAEVLKTEGNLLASENFPDCAPAATPIPVSKTVPYKIKDYMALSESAITKNEILKIKKSLTEKKPILISVKVYSSFDKIKADGIWRTTAADVLEGNHAMCIVGYDDNIAGGAFEVMNSWGTNWGNKGFFWLSYEQFMNYGNAALELMDNEAGSRGEITEVPKLSGKIEFVKLDETVMPVKRTKINTRSIIVEDDSQAEYSQYKLVENYAGGTPFKIKFTTTAPAYVYIFSQDDQQVLSRLFPYNSLISAAINSNNATVYLPSETKHARLSNNPSKENICVLYSKTPINFEELLSYISENKLSISEAIENKFKNNLIALNEVQFSNEEISFKTPADNNKILCFFIQLEHH